MDLSTQSPPQRSRSGGALPAVLVIFGGILVAGLLLYFLFAPSKAPKVVSAPLDGVEATTSEQAGSGDLPELSGGPALAQADAHPPLATPGDAALGQEVNPDDVIAPYTEPDAKQLEVLAQIQEFMPEARLATREDHEAARSMIADAKPTDVNSPEMQEILNPRVLTDEERKEMTESMMTNELPPGDYRMTEKGLELVPAAEDAGGTE